jgi:hypothetical protein
VELRAIAHHQRHRVFTTDIQRGRKTGSDALNAIGVLPPGQLNACVMGSKGDLVAVDGSGGLKRLAHRACVASCS